MAIRGRCAYLIVAILSTLFIASCGGGAGSDEVAAQESDGSGNGNGNDGGAPPGDNQRPNPTPPDSGNADDPAGGGSQPGDPPADPPPGDDDDPPQLYRPEAGPEIEATPVILTLHDPARDKDLDVRVSWPIDGDSLPLVIFSHGNDGSMLAYDPLITHWVSYGYVLIQPDHLDSYLVPIEDRADEFEDWEDRIQDVVFILDSLDQIEADIPVIAGRIDRNRIGMAGHSFGAHTTQMVCGAVTTSNVSYLDSRLRAALMISPQGIGDQLGENSWDGFTNPMMVITGTNDEGRDGQPWTWRMDPYNHAPANGVKHAVVIDGAYHNFGDIYGIGYLPYPPDPVQVSYVRSASTAFLDAYIKELPEAQAYLASDDMEVATDGEIDYQRK
jgi:dienelactone hydrolase